jgi:hypothetical protein
VGGGKADSEYLGATDKRGLITSPLLQPGNYQIKVWPKKYAAEKAQDQLTQEHGEDTIERFLVPVATATAKVESGEVIEISLPGSAGY